MTCDCCQQKCETERYDIYGIVIELCKECFIELQKEVVYVEGLDLPVYIQAFNKLGIVPKTRCSGCNSLIDGETHNIDKWKFCGVCFEILGDFFK